MRVRLPSSPRTVRQLTIVLLASVALATGCTSTNSTPHKTADETRTSPSPSAPPATLGLTSPASQAKKVLTSTSLSFATNGKLRSVQLVGPDNKPVPGNVATDGTTWVPARQLAYDSTYKVTASAANTDGVPTTLTSSFTTMAEPWSITGADLYVTDGETVGVGLPIVVEFTSDIPKSQRAAVERRLMVTSTPAVEGSWHWFSPSEVHYRPKAYWPSGTKVSVRLAIGGLPMGDGNYGRRDRFANFTVGHAVISKVFNSNKTMFVYEDGVLVRKFPISLGKSSTPTSSGTLVAMEISYVKTFDSGTFGVPATAPGGYKEDVYYDVRYTWGGEFVHAAPWSEGDQGYTNVSHGCVNAATPNAKWFYQFSHVGDVIQISGTEKKVAPGDGWTDWTLSWPEYLAGSALH